MNRPILERPIYSWVGIVLPWFLALPGNSLLAREELVPGAKFDPKTNILFPQCNRVVDVTRPPYNARGDGKTDDTDAIQRALGDVMGQHKMVYLPAGTYLVSRTINWSKKNSEGKEAWGMNYVQGQNPLKTIIRLKDGTFTDPSGKTDSSVAIEKAVDSGATTIFLPDFML